MAPTNTFSWTPNAPPVPLVTLADAKAFLRISDIDHDQDVTDLYSRVGVGTKVIVRPMDRRADLGTSTR